MPDRGRRFSGRSRTDARRRARYQARGREWADEPEANSSATTAPLTRRPPLLLRLFPAAPPLPNRPDPLAGFTYSGPARGVVSGAWLLVRHPLPWAAPALAWGLLQVVLLLTPRDSTQAFVLTLGQYTLLISAGWVGWQRPWLFGAAAGAGGFATNVALLAGLALRANTPLGPLDAQATALGAQAALWATFGAFGGFYGGYLRRRMAAGSANRSPTRRARR